MPLRRDYALQFRQTPVEKMAAVLEHDDRQMLRPRPCKHVGERHDVIFFAVNDDRVGRHALGRKAIDGRRDQYNALGVDPMRDPRLYERAERKARERNRLCVAEASFGMRERRECIVRFAVALIERSGRFSDAAEVEANGSVAERKKGLGERIDNLIVERAAFGRQRMRDQRDAGNRRLRRVDDDFERAGGTVNDFALGRLGRQMRSLSTIVPPTMCESMISSMSWRSTYVYQTPSG